MGERAICADLQQSLEKALFINIMFIFLPISVGPSSSEKVSCSFLPVLVTGTDPPTRTSDPTASMPVVCLQRWKGYLTHAHWWPPILTSHWYALLGFLQDGIYYETSRHYSFFAWRYNQQQGALVSLQSSDTPTLVFTSLPWSKWLTYSATAVSEFLVFFKASSICD